MSISEKAIKEFQGIHKKEHGIELSYEEAEDGANRMLGLVEILMKAHVEELQRKKHLKEFPKGYEMLGEGRNCSICGDSVRDKIWYDKKGFKCMICQDSVNRKEIPDWVGTNKESWYSKYDLEGCFNLKGPKLRSWIKKGVIKARPVRYSENGRTHTELFLLQDNKGFLPSKKLVKSEFVKEIIDGKTYHHSEPWYRFVDPFEHLKGYKIMDYMQITESQGDKNKNHSRNQIVKDRKGNDIVL